MIPSRPDRIEHLVSPITPCHQMVGHGGVRPFGRPWDGECQNAWRTTTWPSRTSRACCTHRELQDVGRNASSRKHHRQWLRPVLHRRLSLPVPRARYGAELPVAGGSVWGARGPRGGHLGAGMRDLWNPRGLCPLRIVLGKWQRYSQAGGWDAGAATRPLVGCFRTARTMVWGGRAAKEQGGSRTRRRVSESFQKLHQGQVTRDRRAGRSVVWRWRCNDWKARGATAWGRSWTVGGSFGEDVEVSARGED